MAETLLPQVFRKDAPYMVSYDYLDIAEGTGFQLFYALAGTSELLLRNTPIYSNKVVEFYQEGFYDGDYHLRIDKDYDVLFNKLKIIKGKAIVTITLGCRTLVAESNTCYVIAKVRKWDGANETEIANKQSNTFTSGSTINTTYSKTMCIEINIPQTNFKIGETLRLTIEFYDKLGGNTGNAAFGYGCDPKDREDIVGSPNAYQIIKDADTTKLEFHVPFRLI